ILPSREDRIRGSATTDTLNKKVGVPPVIITRTIQSQRKIQIQDLATCCRFFGECSKLFLNDPLGVKMVVLRVFIVVTRADRSTSQARWPLRPPFPQTVRHRSEARIVFDAFVFTDKVGQLLLSRGSAVGKESLRHLFQDGTLVGHDTTVVYELRRFQRQQ